MSTHTDQDASENAGANSDGATGVVRDDENYVDRERKKLILQRRRDVDEWKRELFTDAKLGDLDYQTAVSLWGDRVRDYLIAVEPLLRDEDLTNATEVYKNEEIGIIEIPPPPEMRVATGDTQGRRNPVVDGYELVNGEPDPVTETITGLKDVIERETVAASWEVQARRVDTTGRRDRRKTITATHAAPLHKTALQNAVRTTDEFLQSVALGVDTSDGLPTFGFEEVGSDQPQPSTNGGGGQ